MLNKIKSMLAIVGIKSSGNNDLNPIKTTQEDLRQVQTIKRVQKHFEDNHELLITRAMRPHGSDCEDTVMCEDMNCFQWEPDKIIGKPYEISYNEVKYETVKKEHVRKRKHIDDIEKLKISYDIIFRDRL